MAECEGIVESTEFAKFPSIEDWRRGKARDGFLKRVAPDDTFVVQEKVDGANIQLLFQPGLPMKVGRRNSWLSEGETFFNIWETLECCREEFARIQETVDTIHETWRFYGEIYGPTVQRRIPYPGCEKGRICIFDAYMVWCEVNRVPMFLPPDCLESVLEGVLAKHLMVPTITILDGVEALKGYMAEHKTKDIPSVLAPGQTAEGVVIRPYKRGYDRESRVILKYRNRAFFEMENAKKPRPQLAPIQQRYLDYFNANRVCSVVSKLGRPTKAAIGKTFIPELKRDALEDFCKDHPQVTPEQTELLKKTKVPNVFNLFLEHME